jgi:hypothetical protein
MGHGSGRTKRKQKRIRIVTSFYCYFEPRGNHTSNGCVTLTSSEFGSDESLPLPILSSAGNHDGCWVCAVCCAVLLCAVMLHNENGFGRRYPSRKRNSSSYLVQYQSLSIKDFLWIANKFDCVTTFHPGSSGYTTRLVMPGWRDDHRFTYDQYYLPC